MKDTRKRERIMEPAPAPDRSNQRDQPSVSNLPSGGQLHRQLHLHKGDPGRGVTGNAEHSRSRLIPLDIMMPVMAGFPYPRDDAGHFGAKGNMRGFRVLKFPTKSAK